jgi:hypothetical protein
MQIIIGVIVVLVILFIGSRLLGGGGDAAAPTAAPDNNEAPVQENSDSGLNLGGVVVAENVDRDGCAVDVADRFGENDTVYAVLEDSSIPEGTRIFARLYRDNEAIEDRDEITADQDYSNVCVSFSFVPEEPWESGDYEVEIIVNGNPYQAASFTIR